MYICAEPLSLRRISKWHLRVVVVVATRHHARAAESLSLCMRNGDEETQGKPRFVSQTCRSSDMPFDGGWMGRWGKKSPVVKACVHESERRMDRVNKEN